MTVYFAIESFCLFRSLFLRLGQLARLLELALLR
jgi:hypothetical protein